MSFRNRGGRWVLIQAALMLLVFALGLRPRVERMFPGSVAVGGSLMAAAALVAIAGASVWGGKLTAFPKPRDDGKLLRSGIYRFVRHPLYASLILLAAGWALFRDSPATATAAAALAVFFDAKARQEERWLRERFPEYEAYARQVNRFIPGVY